MAGDEPMTEYEKKRMLRIRENEARLEALGLRSLAADPLLRNPYPSAAAKRKQKGRSADEDEEYVPSDEGGGEEEEEEEGTSSESGQDDEVDGRSKSSSRSHAKGKKKKLNSSKSYKNASKVSSSFSDFVDDDTALQQAIALSLAASSERSVSTAAAETSSAGLEGSEGTPQKKKSKASNLDFTKKGKNKNVKSRIQLTEDDVVAFFFSFDEVGKGYITPWDLERMATVNDFIWTDSEISNMIRCFDSDGDGKINLEDFRRIVSRCKMLQEPEKCR